jgi:hypothetical protein
MKPKVKRTSVKNKVDNSKFRGIDLFEDYEYQEPKLRAITTQQQLNPTRERLRVLGAS